MKKLIFGGLFLALVGIGVGSCKKEKLQQQTEIQNVKNEFGVSTDGRMLIFSTVADYEKAIVSENVSKFELLFSTIEGLKFKNYFSQSEVKSGVVEKMDDFLGKLLNPEGAIQIEDHIYKVDLDKEKVFVIKSTLKDSDYNDLITGNTSNKNVMEFSTDDDVIHAIKEGSLEKCGGIGSFDKYTDNVLLPSVDAQYFRGRIRFFKGGIIFNLYGEALASYNPGFDKLYIELSPVYYIKRPCGSSNTTGPYNVANYQSHSDFNYAGPYHKYQSYQGSRNLNHCQFRMRVKAVGAINGIVRYTSWVQ